MKSYWQINATIGSLDRHCVEGSNSPPRKCGAVLPQDSLDWDNYVLISTKDWTAITPSTRQSWVNGTLGTDLYSNCSPRTTLHD